MFVAALFIIEEEKNQTLGSHLILETAEWLSKPQSIYRNHKVYKDHMMCGKVVGYMD